MDLDSMKKLRLDRRLLRRRGWISGSELDSALETLPDVSDKVAPPEEDPRPTGATPEAVAEPAPAVAGFTAAPEPEPALPAATEPPEASGG